MKIDAYWALLLRQIVPRECQPSWWPPGCQSCIHLPQSAAHPLWGCWHGTEMVCWPLGSPLCGSHNKTGRTRHHHWEHSTLGEVNHSVSELNVRQQSNMNHESSTSLNISQLLANLNLNTLPKVTIKWEKKKAQKEHKYYVSVKSWCGKSF